MVKKIFDTHTHLNDTDLFEKASEIVKRAEEAGITHMIVPGYDQESSLRAMELAARYDTVFAAVGVHPHDAKSVTDKDYMHIEEWASNSKVVAIGEIGLDYHYDNSLRDVQAEVFRQQMIIADRKNLPIIIHDREAHGDVVNMIKEVSPLVAGGILHSFSGSLEMAQACIEMGFYISFSGPITFKNARRPREVAAALPLDRILVETDAPYLTPEPYRGKQNEPAYVRFVLDKLIEVREEEEETIIRSVYQNALRVFQLKE